MRKMPLAVFALVLLQACFAHSTEYIGSHPDTLPVIVAGVGHEKEGHGISETRMRRIFRDELERVDCVVVFDVSRSHLPFGACSLLFLMEDVRVTYSIRTRSCAE